MSVIGVRNIGLRGLRVKVRLPDGSTCWLPASWTSLGAREPDSRRLAGELPDFVALCNLVRALAQRCSSAQDGGSDETAAGAAGARAALAAVAERAARAAGNA